MAKPIFSKTGNLKSPLTFEKSRALPANEPITRSQIKSVSGGGHLIVYDFGYAVETFRVSLPNCSKDFKDDLIAFFQDSTVNYALNSFDFTDEFGVVHVVRLNTTELDFPKVKGGNYNIEFELRKEV